MEVYLYTVSFISYPRHLKHRRRKVYNIGGGHGLEYWGGQGEGIIPSRHMTSY